MSQDKQTRFYHRLLPLKKNKRLSVSLDPSFSDNNSSDRRQIKNKHKTLVDSQSQIAFEAVQKHGSYCKSHSSTTEVASDLLQTKSERGERKDRHTISKHTDLSLQCNDGYGSISRNETLNQSSFQQQQLLLFGQPFEKLSDFHRTFNGLPILQTLFEKRVTNTIEEYDFIDFTSFPHTQMEEYLQSNGFNKYIDIILKVIENNSIDNLKVDDFIKQNIPIDYAEELMLFIHKEKDKKNFFSDLDKNKNITNTELHKVHQLIADFNAGKVVNLYKDTTLRIVFLLYKHYILSLPEPILSKGIYEKAKDVITKTQTTVMKKQCFLDTLNQDLGSINSIKRKLFNSNIHVIQTIFHRCKMLDETKNDCLSFFYNSNTHTDSSYKNLGGILPYLPNIHPPELVYGIEYYFQYEGERVKYRMPRMYCPIRFYPTYNQLPPFKGCDKGTLFITTYRIIFISDDHSNSFEKNLLTHIRQVPIHSINSLKLFGNKVDKEFGVKISTKDSRILFFMCKYEIKSIFSQIIQSLQSTFALSFETEGLLVNKTSLRQIVTREMNRLCIPNTFSLILTNKKDPIYPSHAYHYPNIICCQDSSKYAYISYRTPNNSYLLQFTFSSRTSNNGDITLTCKTTTPIPKFMAYSITFPKTKRLYDDFFLAISQLDLLTSIDNFENSIKIFEDALVIYSKSIKEVLWQVKSIAIHISQENSVCILLPNNTNQHSVNIISALIQIIADPICRSFQGFIDLLAREFSWKKYPFTEQSDTLLSNYIMFLACVVTILRPNIIQFEFTIELLIFLAYHSISKRFGEFFEVYNESSSLYKYLYSHKNEFLNTSYESGDIKIYNQFPICIELFHVPFTYSMMTKKTIKSLQQKEKLEFHNGLVYFPFYQGMITFYTTLTELDLSHNNLHLFPNVVTQLTQLRTLNLSYNKIASIGNEIKVCTSLKHVNLSSNQFQRLTNFDSLTMVTLDVSSNPLYQLTLPTLNTLYLCKMSNKISITTQNINTLHLSNNSTSLLGFFCKSFIKIKELHITDSDIKLLPLTITKLTGLSTLCVEKCKLHLLPYGIQGLTSLQHLSLKNNELQRIPITLTKLSKLTLLEINGNLPTITVPTSLYHCLDIKLPSQQKQLKNERIIVLGDEFERNDIMQYFSRKVGKSRNGPLLENVDILRSKGVEQVTFEELSIETFEERPLKYAFVGSFILCGSSATVERLFVLLKRTKTSEKIIKVINTNTNLEKDVSWWNGEEVYKQITKKRKRIQHAQVIVDELNSFNYHGGVLRISQINLLIKECGFCEKHDVFNELSGLGIVVVEGYKYALINSSYLDVIRKECNSIRTKNGLILPPNLYKLLSTQISSSHLDFLLKILEILQNNVLINEEFINKYAPDTCLSNIINDLQDICSSPQRSFPKHTVHSYSQSESCGTESNNSSTPISQSNIQNLLPELPNDSSSPNFSSSPSTSHDSSKFNEEPYILFNRYALPIQISTEQHWPTKHHPLEVEIGRVYVFKYFPKEFISQLLAALCLRYKILSIWRYGIICSHKELRGDIYLYFSTIPTKNSITLHVRYLLDNDMPFHVYLLLSNIHHLLTALSLPYNTTFTTNLKCSCCLNKSCHIFTESYLKNSIENELFERIESDDKKHHIILPLNGLDQLFIHLHSIVGHSILYSDFKTIQTIANGSSSLISRASFKHISNLIVVKETIVDIGSFRHEGKQACINEFLFRVGEFIHEVFAMRFPPSTCLAQVLAYVEQPLCILVESFDGGNLYDYIQNNKQPDINWIMTIASQIAEGIKILHSMKIPHIHRDLKSPNVVLRLNGKGQVESAALTDYGETIPSIFDERRVVVECPFWIAPEVIKTGLFSLASDIFSFGMILWELISWKKPFAEVSNLSLVRDMVLDYQMPIIPDTFKGLDTIVRLCWEQPDNRPTMSNIELMINSYVKYHRDNKTVKK